MKEGYIPISRRLFEHPFWCEERIFSRFEAWIDLLQEARFEDTKELINNRLVTVMRGQIPISLRYLGTRWGWSTKKVNSFLDMLLSDKMIKKETPKETGQTVVTICNYDKYNLDSETRKQQKKQTGNTEETPGKQQGNNINKENKYNNIFSPPAYAYEGEFSPEVFEKSLPDCYNALITDQMWLEGICMNNHITAEQFMSKLQEFFKKLQNEGGKTKSVKDGQSHFARWLAIDLQKQKPNKQQSSTIPKKGKIESVGDSVEEALRIMRNGQI